MDNGKMDKQIIIEDELKRETVRDLFIYLFQSLSLFITFLKPYSNFQQHRHVTVIVAWALHYQGYSTVYSGKCLFL